MSITQLYTSDEFFTKIDPKEFKVGQLCWVPVAHLEPIPRILDVQRRTPEEHEHVEFELRLANQPSDFKRRDRGLPVKYLNLMSNEELLAQRCKKRPAIILGTKVDCYPEIEKILRQKGKKHQQQDCIFVVPCYHIQQDEYDFGIIKLSGYALYSTIYYM